MGAPARLEVQTVRSLTATDGNGEGVFAAREPGAAMKYRSSLALVVSADVLAVPAELVDQKPLLPHVPLAVRPPPAAVPLESQ